MSDVDSIKNLINGDPTYDELHRLIHEGDRLIAEYIDAQDEDLGNRLKHVLDNAAVILTGRDLSWALSDLDSSGTFSDGKLSEDADVEKFLGRLLPLLGLMEQLKHVGENPWYVEDLTEAKLRLKLNPRDQEAGKALLELATISPGKLFGITEGRGERGFQIATVSPAGAFFWSLLPLLKGDWRSIGAGFPPGLKPWLLDSLEYLEAKYRPISEPDADRGTVILDFAYLSAAYGLILFKQEASYSEESIKAFEESFRAYFSVYHEIGVRAVKDRHRDSEIYHQATLQVLVGLHLSRIRAGEQDWTEAIQMYAHALACLDAVTGTDYDQVVQLDIFKEEYAGLRQIGDEEPIPIYDYMIVNEWERHRQSMNKDAARAFGHLRQTSGSGVSWQEVSDHVHMICSAMESEFVDPDSELRPYWMEAQGWLRGSKLEPGELRDELRREEDEKAEQRLRRYFFDNAQWSALPERAQRNLVEADRVWYSHRLGNPGAALENIKIAVEEVMHDLFWEPCCQWIDTGGPTGFEKLDIDDFEKIRETLKEPQKNPSLLEFESMVESKGLTRFLQTLDLSDYDRSFVRKLRKSLRSLRETRNQVTHDVGGPTLNRGQVAPLYKTFMGLGQEGILPRLARIKADLERRDSLPTPRG